MLKHDEALFQKIRIISNSKRFKILEMTQGGPLSITELSSQLNIAYNKCADYIRIMDKVGLIQKERMGKKAMIRSKVKISKNKIEFLHNPS